MHTVAVQMDCHIAAATRAEIDSELAAIRTRAYAALGLAPSTAPKRTVRSRSKPARARASATRSDGQVSDERFLAAVEKMGGASATRIAGRVGLSPNAALSRLRKLEQAGVVHREGTRQQTRWFARAPVAA